MPAKFKGMTKTIRQFKKFRDEGLEKAAQDGVDRSIKKLELESAIQVPKDTGALLGTQIIVVISASGPKRSKAVRFGQPGEGESVIDYAAAVHEILKARHALPTKAKFVEDPLVQGVPYYERVTKYECRRQVRRVFR